MDEKTQVLIGVTVELALIQAARDAVAEQAAKLLKVRRDPRQREILRRAAEAQEEEEER